MHKRAKNKISAVLFLLLIAGCKTKHNNDVLHVYFEDIPQAIQSRENIDTYTYYLLHQTHEPLFRQDDGQNFSSRILKSWSRNTNYRSFTFCPDTSLQFDSANRFSMPIFEKYISTTLKEYGEQFVITSDSQSVTIVFSKRQTGFLNFLTLYEHAPVIYERKNETGLGPFATGNWSEKEAVLVRKTPIKNGINKILIHRYDESVKKMPFTDENIDFNMVSSFQQPAWIKERYVPVITPELRTVDLVINHPDKQIRRMLYNCINVSAFRQSFVPLRNDFHDVQNILPVGMPGAISGQISQQCAELPQHVRKSIVLLNQRDDNTTTLAAFVKTLREQTGINIEIKNISPKEHFKIVQSGKNYNLAVIIMDTLRPDYQPFFEFLLGAKGCLKFLKPSSDSLYGMLSKQNNSDASQKAALQLAKMLQTEYAVLPLYQTFATDYYPKNLQITAGHGFISYPEVGDFRW